MTLYGIPALKHMRSERANSFAGTVEVFDRWGQKFSMDVAVDCD